MPAIMQMRPEPLVQALASREVREAGAVLRKWAERGTVTATACVGTFVLAEASLLDEEEATTSWWLSPLFRQRYPRVRLDESRLKNGRMHRAVKLVTEAWAAISCAKSAGLPIRGADWFSCIDASSA